MKSEYSYIEIAFAALFEGRPRADSPSHWKCLLPRRQLKWTRPTFGSDYVCCIDRKPDPSVQVCIAKPPYKAKDGVIQLLDYNLARFDFQDLKGQFLFS